MRKGEEKPRKNKPYMHITPQVFDKICRMIATTPDCNDDIVKRCGVSPASFYNALHDKDNLEKYFRAKMMHAEVRPSAFRKRLQNATPEMAPLLKIELDEMKWSNARDNPKRWRDNIDVTSGGDKVSGFVVVYEKPDDAKTDAA